MAVLLLPMSSLAPVRTKPELSQNLASTPGLAIFGAVFAVNSALHSYLILAFTQSERVTMDVGFYYMANAAGRLLGTLLSGWTYQIVGLVGCLTTATLMVGVSVLATIRLNSGYKPQADS